MIGVLKQTICKLQVIKMIRNYKATQRYYFKKNDDRVRQMIKLKFTVTYELRTFRGVRK